MFGFKTAFHTSGVRIHFRIRERMESPTFKNEPLELENILSETGKQSILEFKVGQLLEGTKRFMLRGHNITDLLNRRHSFSMHYDCRRLELFIAFPDPDMELAFVRNTIITGVERACLERGVPSILDRIGFTEKFDNEDPRVANIVVGLAESEC